MNFLIVHALLEDLLKERSGEEPEQAITNERIVEAMDALTRAEDGCME